MAANIDLDPSIVLSREPADKPYVSLKLLGDDYPVYCNPVMRQWMAIWYEGVMNIFADTENFAAYLNGNHIGAVFGPTLMEYDGEEHRKRRGVVGPEFV